jgi:hypothetical protein
MADQAVDYDVLFSHPMLNGLVVQIERSELAALNDLPGVERAWDQVGTLDNATSVPPIGAPQAWDAGFTGKAPRSASSIWRGLRALEFSLHAANGAPKYAGGMTL